MEDAACFNPRPARWLGETCVSSYWYAVQAGFNPRPARWLGETGFCRCRRARHEKFQSTPSAVAGRNHLQPQSHCHAGRFNPRPARWLGETDILAGAVYLMGVSIHAQRGGWAKHLQGCQWQLNIPVSIHAQRGGWAKPGSLSCHKPRSTFQSTPSAVAGRNPLTREQLTVPVGFNPRPARWLGETFPTAVGTAGFSFQSTPSAVAGRNRCRLPP